MDIDVKTIISKLDFEVHNTKKKIVGNRYEPLEDKAYPKTYYNYQPRSVAIDEALAKIKAHEL